MADLLERCKNTGKLSQGLATLVAQRWEGIGVGTTPNTFRNLTSLSGEKEAEGVEVEEDDVEMAEAN